MGFVDYISRIPYQPTKYISNNKGKFLIATLSNIKSDAKLLQKSYFRHSSETILSRYHILYANSYYTRFYTC